MGFMAPRRETEYTPLIIGTKRSIQKLQPEQPLSAQGSIEGPHGAQARFDLKLRL
jgi:hypothetical protein